MQNCLHVVKKKTDSDFYTKIHSLLYIKTAFCSKSLLLMDKFKTIWSQKYAELQSNNLWKRERINCTVDKKNVYSPLLRDNFV